MRSAGLAAKTLALYGSRPKRSRSCEVCSSQQASSAKAEAIRSNGATKPSSTGLPCAGVVPLVVPCVLSYVVPLVVLCVVSYAPPLAVPPPVEPCLSTGKAPTSGATLRLEWAASSVVVDADDAPAGAKAPPGRGRPAANSSIASPLSGTVGTPASGAGA